MPTTTEVTGSQRQNRIRLVLRRISGPGRVWGIREEHVLDLLWWDPRHEVCPSPKKHT